MNRQETDAHFPESGVSESNLSIQWMIFSSLTILSQIAFAFYYFRNDDWHAGTLGGITYGAVAGIGLLYLAFYRVRRSIYRIRLGSMRWWYLGHLHVGFLSILFVFLHTGYRFHGVFSLFLLLLYILVVASGIAGWFIYAMLPVSNARQIGAMYVESELIEDIENRSREIKEYLSSKARYISVLAEKYIGDCHQNNGANVKRILMSERELLNQMKRNFNRMKSELPPHELYSLDLLQSLCMEREKSIARVLRFRLMRGWLNLHVPLTSAMLTAIVIHLFSIWYF